MAELKRIFDLLPNYEKNFSKKVMVAGKSIGKWKTYDTTNFLKIVDNCSRGLALIGLNKGDKVAIMSANRPEWNFCDFGIMQLGAASVPLYPTLSDQDLTHIINDAEVKIIFLSDKEMYDKMIPVLHKSELNIPIYSFDKIEGIPSWEDLLEKGNSSTINLEEYKNAVHEDDLLTLIYTAGTTGRPKGVCLSHKNLLSNVKDSQTLFPDNYKTAISFLPLSHIFERMVVYMYYSIGVSIYYAESMDTIIADINEIKPHGFTTVPRVLEKVYEKIVAKGTSLTGIKKKIFFWSLNLGLRFQEPENNNTFYNFQLAIARKLVFKKWQEALGGNIVAIISGGAALQPRLARIFWAAGIPVLEGYGLTETSPVLTVNGLRKGELKFASVGKPLQSVELKIAEDGEVLCKGPNITLGYYKNDMATAEAIDKEGFFHTGDIGEITPDGFLRITDRKKEMFKTAGGKYIAPQVLENKIMESIFIAQVMVVGENRRFPSALIVPAFEELKAWCLHKKIKWTTKEEMIQNKEVIDKYQRELDRLNTSFGHWEQIKRFILLPQEWTIAAGELTPKLSLKRKAILQKQQDKLDHLYNEATSPIKDQNH
jgi:long-chain acyl-CoA synthetase